MSSRIPIVAPVRQPKPANVSLAGTGGYEAAQAAGEEERRRRAAAAGGAVPVTAEQLAAGNTGGQVAAQAAGVEGRRRDAAGQPMGRRQDTFVDDAVDAVTLANPLVGGSLQLGKAIYNGARGVANGGFLGNVLGETPPGAVPRRVNQVTRLDRQQRAAFDPTGNPAISGRYNPYNAPGVQDAVQGARSYGDDGRRKVEAADTLLMNGFSGSQPATVTQVRPQNVLANTSASSAGMDRAVDYLGNTQDSRTAQGNVQGTAMDWASGNMPSVGRDIANEAGAVAAEQFARAGSETNQAYGTSAVAAAKSFAEAQAAQNYATQQAGRTAARQTTDAASDAVLRQAALTSAARGGNIGMALRTGLQGAAVQSGAANREGARLMGDANTQASYQAAIAQRQAEATQATGNLATQGTQERALTAAAAAEEQARLRAAQIGSQEQQNMLALAGSQADAMRSGDVASTQAATGIANTGVNVDQMVNAVNVGNADRAFSGDTFNAGANLQNQQFAQQMGLSYDQLNSGNFNQVANRGAGAAQFGLGTEAQFAGMSAANQRALAEQQILADQNLATIYMNLDEAAKDRMLQAYGVQQGVAVQGRGQNIQLLGAGAGALGTVGAAALMASDRRVKRDIKTTKAPDFRKAGSYQYRYKDPKLPGAAPGKHSGPMAQELPKEFVTKGKDGVLRVDTSRLALAAVSAIGDLQRRIDAA